MKGRKKSVIHKTFSDEQLRINQSFKASLLGELKKLNGENSMAKKVQHLPLRQLIRQKNFMYVGGFAALLIIASGIYALDNRSNNLASQQEIKDIIALPQNLEGVLGVDEMRTLASSDAPTGSTVTGIEIENEHGVVLYKVKFSDGSYRLYDAKTGLAYEKTKDDTDESTEIDDSVPTGFVAGISLQKARDIAQAQRPGKTITKIELETENGVVVYSVRFSDEGRVDVNASDGSIVRLRDGRSSTTGNEDSDDDSSSSSGSSNEDSDDSVDSEDHEEEDVEDDGDRSGSNSGSVDKDR